jgi:ribonuclease HI
VRWQKPDAWIVKINTDGAFNVASLSGATGAVIRDEHGSFLKASSQQIR